jgi:hypothetical protein
MCKGGVMTTPFRRVSVNVTAWLAGAVASVSVGILALSQIDDGFGGAGVQPLNPDVVITVAAGRPSVDPTVPSGGKPHPSGGKTDPSPAKSQASPAATGPAADEPDAHPADTDNTERVLTSPGGSLVARCSAGRAYLASWSPAQGYRAEEVRRGPAEEASLIFEGPQRNVVTIRCVAGVPQASISQEPGEEDHGDGR